ncbi:hypothetical protein TCAL_13368, partial [Tigriopus californicus]
EQQVILSTEDAANALLNQIRVSDKGDAEYASLINYLHSYRSSSADAKMPAELVAYRAIMDNLSANNELALFGHQIVIAKPFCRHVLDRLHGAHQGIDRTLCRARYSVYWPGITAAIKSTHGRPRIFVLDVATQFLASATQDFLKDWGILHRVSLPRFSQSNGLAENAVQSLKAIVKKTKPDDDHLIAHMEQRDISRACGVFLWPTDLYFGTLASWPSCPFVRCWHVLDLDVFVQDPKTKLWDSKGKIIEVQDNQKLLIEMSDESVRLWNRKFVRSAPASHEPSPVPPLTQPNAILARRQSTRSRKKPGRPQLPK